MFAKLDAEMIDHVLLCSALELFLIKRKIKGPSWLSISNFVSCPASQRVCYSIFAEAIIATSVDYIGLVFVWILCQCQADRFLGILTGQLVQV